MKDIEKLKELYVDSESDPEARLENEAWIKQFEADYQHTQAYADWQESDITKEIAKRAREVYVSASLTLATSRNLDDTGRERLWAEQDAARWLLSLTETDARSTLVAMENTIRAKLSATN